MPTDAFFEHVTAKRPAYAELRYSKVSDSCIVRLDDKSELVTGVADDVQLVVAKHLAAWNKRGFTPAKKPALPDILTPAVVEGITGLTVPARYAKFLDDGTHRKLRREVLYQGVTPAAGKISGVPGFPDGVPIVFDEPTLPFLLVGSARATHAPTSIPVALFESNRLLLIDSKTGKVFAYDDSATEPLVLVARTFDALLKLVGK